MNELSSKQVSENQGNKHWERFKCQRNRWNTAADGKEEETPEHTVLTGNGEAGGEPAPACVQIRLSGTATLHLKTSHENQPRCGSLTAHRQPPEKVTACKQEQPLGGQAHLSNFKARARPDTVRLNRTRTTRTYIPYGTSHRAAQL